ncbi:hypothetical protein Btru_051462 [Bulinus truncatus]|nr:hypothetical protein Btru_051462 [Bulinus truncatus]
MDVQDSNLNDNQDRNLKFSDMNVDLPPVTKQPIHTAIGKCQRCQDLTALEIVYIICTLVSIIAAVGFTIYRMATVDKTHPDFTFCIFLLVNAAFCIFFTVDAIFRERPSEIIILSITTIIILLYLIINYAAGTKNDIKLARLIIACISCPVLVVMGMMIAKKYFMSGHLIFRTVGALDNMQKLYRSLLYLQDGLKIDLQLGVSLVIFVLDGNKTIETHEIVILVVGLIVEIGYFFLGWIAFSRELRPFVITFWVVGSIAFFYIFWKIYDVTLYITHFSGLAGATIMCIIAAILVRIAVIIGSVFVYRNFDKGLKEKIGFGDSDIENDPVTSSETMS